MNDGPILSWLRKIKEAVEGLTVSVDNVGINDTTDTQIDPATKQKQDEQLTALASILAAILPDGHNVNVANEVEVTLNGEAIALDAATIAALQTITVNQGTSPWVVSGTVTSTPSGTQDVNIVSAVELEVTLNGEQVDIGNFPTEYPLPAAQVTTLTPQKDALTNAQLRTSDVEVNDDVLQGKIDTLNATDFAISANQLPDGHNVTANKGTGWVDPQTNGLTDAELRATAVKVDDDETQAALATIAANQLPNNHQVQISNEVEVTLNGEAIALDAATLAALETIVVNQGTSPWVVSGTVTSTPSGVQDVNVVSSVELEVTLNGEPVSVDNFPAALSVIGSGSGANAQRVQLSDESLAALENITVTISNEVEIKNDVGNPVPVSGTVTADKGAGWVDPQTDALTDAQLRATAVKVDDDQTQSALATIAGNQLPDNHNVTVSNFTVQLDGLTDNELRAAPVVVDTQLTQPTTPADTQPVSGTVSVDNFPANQTDALTDAQLRASPVKVDDDQTQAALAIIASNQLPDNHQVTVSNQITGFATAANQQTDALTEAELRTVIPDTQGAWGYDAGTSGTLNVAANKRVMQITATAGILGATMTINGGSTITIPAGRSLTIEPRANLTAPTIVFTNTTAYFVEWVE